MITPKMDPLLLAGRFVTLLIQGVIIIGAIGVTGAIGLVTFQSERVVTWIADKHAEKVNDAAAFADLPSFTIVLMFLSVLAMMAFAFLFFTKLRAMIDSVGLGDPFSHESAQRMGMMAWLCLAFHAAMAMVIFFAFTIQNWARTISDIDFEVPFSIDLGSVLMVLTLFILARVFKLGAQMRDDLEGTV